MQASGWGRLRSVSRRVKSLWGAFVTALPRKLGAGEVKDRSPVGRCSATLTLNRIRSSQKQP